MVDVIDLDSRRKKPDSTIELDVEVPCPDCGGYGFELWCNQEDLSRVYFVCKDHECNFILYEIEFVQDDEE